MTETMAEDRPETTQEQPEPTSNGDPPEDVLSQIEAIETQVADHYLRGQDQLPDPAPRNKLTDAWDKFCEVSKVAKPGGDIETVTKAANTFHSTATTLIDKSGVPDSDEFTETEAAEETGNSADVVEDVHQEDDPVEVSPKYPDQNPIHDKAVRSLLNVLVDRIQHGELRAAQEALEALDVRVGEVLAPEPDCGTLDDVPFGEHDAERPPTDEELAEPDPIADPILIIEGTEDVVVAHGRNTTIFGKPGGGKTWLALWITILVARSGGRVVYYNWDQSTEKGNKKLWRRLMRLKYWHPSYRDRIRIIAAKQFTPEELAERRKLANEWLKAGKSPELALVVIDTISNAGGAVNNGRDYKAFAEVAIEPHSLEDIGTLSLAHEAKNEPNGPFGSVLALADCDTALRAVCLKGQTMFNRQQSGEFTLILKKDREGDSATPEEAPVAVIEGDPSEGFLNLRCKPPTSRVEQMLDDSTGPRDLRGDILKLIKGYGGEYVKGRTRLLKELGCNSDALDAALAELEADGIIKIGKVGRTMHYKLIQG